MQSTSAQPSATSTVRLRSEDPERQRSPDGEHHEGLLAEHLRHVPAGQRNFLHEGQEGPRRHQRCRRTSSTTRNSTVDPAAADGEVSPRTSEADLPTDRRSDDVTLADGLVQRSDWRVLPSSPTRRQIKYCIQPRRKDTTITRLRLGHSKMNAGLHKIRLRDNADCAICRKPETTEHFLLTCPVQRQLQDELRRECIRTNRSYDIKTILTTASCTDVFYDWIMSTKRQL